MGLRKYLDAEWQKAYPTAESRTALLKVKRPDFEKKYTKAYHIFFNEIQDPAFKTNAAGVAQKKRELAQQAWNRLEKGESFEAVAKAMSEDRISGAQGGFIGFVPATVFGKEFADALAQLSPGTYSKPVQSTWGYHIIRREVMTDDDLLTILQDDFEGKMASATSRPAGRRAQGRAARPGAREGRRIAGGAARRAPAHNSKKFGTGFERVL